MLWPACTRLRVNIGRVMFMLGTTRLQTITEWRLLWTTLLILLTVVGKR